MVEARHVSVDSGVFEGNKGHGRYVFLPGSRSRAKKISEHFFNTKVFPSERGHDLYTGQLNTDSGAVDVAVLSSGMGVGSLEIIVTELYMLGARMFIRVGTSGSLQPDVVRVPSNVIANSRRPR